MALPKISGYRRPQTVVASTAPGSAPGSRRSRRPPAPHAADVGLIRVVDPLHPLRRLQQHHHIQHQWQDDAKQATEPAPGYLTAVAAPAAVTAVAAKAATALAANASAAAAAAVARAQELAPKLALLACAFLWGSYAPAVRLLYESPQPPDAVVVMAVRGTLQAAVLCIVSLAAAGTAEPPAQQQQQQAEAASDAADSGTSSSQDGSTKEPAAEGSLLERWLFLRSPPLWAAALELGLWNYSATALQVRCRGMRSSVSCLPRCSLQASRCQAAQACSTRARR